MSTPNTFLGKRPAPSSDIESTDPAFIAAFPVLQDLSPENYQLFQQQWAAFQIRYRQNTPAQPRTTPLLSNYENSENSDNSQVDPESDLRTIDVGETKNLSLRRTMHPLTELSLPFNDELLSPSSPAKEVMPADSLQI
jgi:hypothetical protein